MLDAISPSHAEMRESSWCKDSLPVVLTTSLWEWSTSFKGSPSAAVPVHRTRHPELRKASMDATYRSNGQLVALLLEPACRMMCRRPGTIHSAAPFTSSATADQGSARSSPQACHAHASSGIRRPGRFNPGAGCMDNTRSMPCHASCRPDAFLDALLWMFTNRANGQRRRVPTRMGTPDFCS